MNEKFLAVKVAAKTVLAVLLAVGLVMLLISSQEQNPKQTVQNPSCRQTETNPNRKTGTAKPTPARKS